MQTRRNVSAQTRLISACPIGKPISTPGAIHGKRPTSFDGEQAEVRVRREREDSASIERTTAIATLKLVLREALVVPEQRERRARDRRQAVEQPDAETERRRRGLLARNGSGLPAACSRISGSSVRYARA